MTVTNAADPGSILTEDELAAAMDPAVLAEIIFQEGLNICPESDAELHAYIELYYGFSIPRQAVCPGHCSPFEAMADVFFMRNPEEDALWTGGRGSGKTLDFAILEHLLLRFFGDEIANIGAVEAQAEKCYGYIEGFCNRDHFRGDLKKRPMITKTFFKPSVVHPDACGKIEIMPATKKRVNSPHPRLAMWDEVDQTPWEVLQEGISMPIRQNGRPPQTVFTSSLKYAYGPMIRLMDGAAERALRRYTWCVYEIIERCPETRHKGGEGCNDCGLREDCLDNVVHEDGTISLLPGPGKASRADGFMPIDDVIKKYRGLDSDTWDSQWRSKRPSVKGLIYPMFDELVHVVDYDYNPALPVYVGIDFGYANPTAAVFLQVVGEHIVVFDEYYEAMRTTKQTGHALQAMPCFGNTLWRVGDPAAADARATLQQMGIDIAPADNDVDKGLEKVRWLLKPQGRDTPLIYFARRCVNLIGEVRHYHTADRKDDRNVNEDPVKNDDHACDALRYAINRLIKRKQ